MNLTHDQIDSLARGLIQIIKTEEWKQWLENTDSPDEQESTSKQA